MKPLDAAVTLAGVLRVLLPVRDILDGRVEDAEPPVWCTRRGWADFLLALDDETLRRCEEETLVAHLPAMPGAPEDLMALAREVSLATRLPALVGSTSTVRAPALRSVPARKQQQLPALLGAVSAMAQHAARIVDVGAGSGHFTVLAADRFAREALGIERNPERVAAAARAAEKAVSVAPGALAARFVTQDACQEALDLAADDLAVGLHACGELGDRLVVAAAAAGCDVALVSCCLQKIATPTRAPISQPGAGLTLRRETLGLANLTSQAQGVETSLDATLLAREARYALERLLRNRGVVVAPGEEMRGINRRRAHAGLAVIAAAALERRGVPPPEEEEIRHHEDDARRAYARMRRLSLPRNMLARLLEIAVVLDRAAALEEHGQHVRVVTLCDRVVTPRNIALFASRSAERLPAGSPPPLVA